MKKNNFFKFLIILTVLILFGVVLQRHRTGQISSDITESPSTPSSLVVLENSTRAEDPSLKDRAQDKRKYSAMMSSGLRIIPSVAESKSLKIRVRVKAVEIDCSLGDFDFLKGSVDRLHEDNFLLSVESAVGAATKVTRRLSLYQLASSPPMEIQLPRSTRPRDYSISICFDFKRTGECGSKPFLEGREWRTLLNKVKNSERVFYYQAISTKEEVAYLIPSSQWDSAFIQRIKTSLRTVLESPNSVDKLKIALDKLGSIPARISADDLVLPLAARRSDCR